MAASGEVPGISGITARILRCHSGDTAWRILFLVGLIGGAGVAFLSGIGWQDFSIPGGRNLVVMAVAGFLVGLGTRVGGGCTSGHGGGHRIRSKGWPRIHAGFHGGRSSYRPGLEFREWENSTMRWLAILLGGALFGLGMVVSGMTDPTKVIGFLDFFGPWDPSLVFVMGSAVITFALGLFFLRRYLGKSSSINLPDLSTSSVEKRLVIGSIIFGIGWGLGGFCPGPALANLSVLRSEALVFVPLMLVGMFFAQRVFGLDR